MPHEISFDTTAGIIRVRYRGEVTLEEREAAIRETCFLAEGVGCRRILLDFREAHSIEGDPAAGIRIADVWASRFVGARVAYLIINDHQVNDLVERLARERGLEMIRFRDRDLAVQWLQEGGRDGAVEATAGPTRPDPGAGAPRPEAADARQSADRLMDRVLDPAVAISPAVYSVTGKLVRELLDAGLAEDRVVDIARRVAAAIMAASAR